MTAHADRSASDFNRSNSAPKSEWLLPLGERFYRNILKRIVDTVVVLIALPIVLPTILILAALVALDGHSPFYSQKRVGKSGRVFVMWKLRSMVKDADKRLALHLASDDSARLEWDEFQKLVNDPRITSLGRYLRKSSLDELPQLWNVLTGDMSLVGPRPMMPEQKLMYPGHAYFMLRPGITGLWQISERNLSTFAQRAEFDATYYRILSFGTDVKVLAATVGVVLRGTGR